MCPVGDQFAWRPPGRSAEGGSFTDQYADRLHGPTGIYGLFRNNEQNPRGEVRQWPHTVDFDASGVLMLTDSQCSPNLLELLRIAPATHGAGN